MTVLIIDFLICLFIWFAIRIWFNLDKMITVVIMVVYFFAFSPYFHALVGTRDAEREYSKERETEDNPSVEVYVSHSNKAFSNNYAIAQQR